MKRVKKKRGPRQEDPSVPLPTFPSYSRHRDTVCLYIFHREPEVGDEAAVPTNSRLHAILHCNPRSEGHVEALRCSDDSENSPRPRTHLPRKALNLIG